MAAILSILTVLVLVGCQKSDTTAQPRPEPVPDRASPPTHPTTPPPPQMSTSEVKLTWSATPTGGQLVVAYKVENGSNADIFVADKLMERGALVARLVVMNGSDANGNPTIRLVRGLVMPDAERVTGVPLPSVVKLAAKQTLDARVELALPLAAWHNAGKMRPLDPAAKTMVLEVATFAAENTPPHWLRGTPLPAP